MNGTVVKNQLIFDFASGILGPAKSLFASTYLQLNSNASKISNTFENMLGENLIDNENIHPKNLKYTDCINNENIQSGSNLKDPVTSFFGNLEGSFCDVYCKYSKGYIQINDQKIKHTPIASKDTGCVCLSITEKDVIFFGKYGSFLNLFTFIKSFFKQK